VGGDYFDVLRLDGNRLAICIADVSGKGVPAALLMANVQASRGVERVAAFGKAHAASSAAKLNEQLLAQVSDFCAAQFQDDATLVVLAVN
jgi:adenylate cyclase